MRLNAFWGDHGSHCVNPFLSVHAGLAAVELVPFRDSASNELIGGYLLGGSAGVDIGGDRERPPTQLQISFDIPSFGTNQGAAAPVGELSLALLAARRW